MNCTVYPDKLYNWIVGPLFVAVLAGFWYIAWTHLHRDLVFLCAIGFIGLIALSGLVASLFRGKGPTYRVDESGVYDRRQFKTVVPWSDVVAVERMPLKEKTGDGETVYHLREGWRPVVLTLRQTDKYLGSVRKTIRSVLLPAVPLKTMSFRFEFVGLEPKSEEFHRCVLHHLARQNRQ